MKKQVKTKLDKSKKQANPEGRPPKFKTADELKINIDLYFKIKCKDEIIKDKATGQPLTDTKGRLVIKYNPPTISGMALFLGFQDRQSIYDYIGRSEEFSYTIKRAIAYIEDYAEKQLFIGNSTGAIFWLKNRGWVDKTENETTHKSEDFNIKVVYE